MAAGLTTFALISGEVNDILENSLAVARSATVLTRTVTGMSATGMFDRKAYEWNSVSWVQAGEDDDTGAQKFTKDNIATLSPASWRTRIDLTDQEVESDWDMVRANAEMEMGSGAATLVDEKIATNFSSITGGTIGDGTGTITWDYIAAAYARINNQKIPAAAPVFCALHPFQWYNLLQSATTAGSSIAVNENFSQDITTATNFYNVPQYQNVTFVISNNIAIDASTIAYGAMYVPQAFAVDTRKAFNIRPQRNESRELTELNASIWFAHGVWRSDFAIALKTLAETPSP